MNEDSDVPVSGPTCPGCSKTLGRGEHHNHKRAEPPMTTDNPESIRCPECHALADQPCHGLNQMITVGGVTRRAVHAARYAANLPPGERAAYWRSVAEGYYADELREGTNA